MAKLYETPRAGEHHDEKGPEALRGEGRSEKQARRFPLGSRFSRRACANRAALLHELGGASVHPEGGPGEGGLRGVSEALCKKERKICLRAVQSIWSVPLGNRSGSFKTCSGLRKKTAWTFW